MATREAVARADALLLEHLSPAQRDDYGRTRSFLVVTPGGRRYRLHGDRVNYQADLLAPDSEYVLAQYCVQPRDGQIPKSDSLLAQMLLLQTDEALFLFTANVNPKVSLIPRYLSGEIRPRQRIAPSTPQHEPDGFDVPRVIRDNRLRAGGPTNIQPITVGRPSRMSEAEQQVLLTYRCVHHIDAGVHTLSVSDDGRGWRVRYDCDCPTQYVSLRAHEERETQDMLRVGLVERAIESLRRAAGP